MMTASHAAWRRPASAHAHDGRRATSTRAHRDMPIGIDARIVASAARATSPQSVTGCEQAARGLARPCAARSRRHVDELLAQDVGVPAVLSELTQDVEVHPVQRERAASVAGEQFLQRQRGRRAA